MGPSLHTALETGAFMLANACTSHRVSCALHGGLRASRRIMTYSGGDDWSIAIIGEPDSSQHCAACCITKATELGP